MLHRERESQPRTACIGRLPKETSLLADQAQGLLYSHRITVTIMGCHNHAQSRRVEIMWSIT